MCNITRTFSTGFTRGVIKSVDIGNISKPRRIKHIEGINIRKSWEHVGNSIRKSMKSTPHASR